MADARMNANHDSAERGSPRPRFGRTARSAASPARVVDEPPVPLDDLNRQFLKFSITLGTLPDTGLYFRASVCYARRMTIVREVSDAMELVAKTIDNGRQIVAALHDARAYLRKRYPDAREDLAGLLAEMRKTLLGLAKVSDVVTDFRFTISGSARDLEPARFNQMVIDRKSRLEEFSQSISALRGSSGRMRDYATALTSGTGRSFWELFDGMGLSQLRAMDVGAKFNDLYVVDERIVDLFEMLLNAAKTALDDVSHALGPPGTADPANVPVAARVLGEYTVEFRRAEQGAHDLARQLDDEISALG